MVHRKMESSGFLCLQDQIEQALNRVKTGSLDIFIIE